MLRRTETHHVIARDPKVTLVKETGVDNSKKTNFRGIKGDAVIAGTHISVNLHRRIDRQVLDIEGLPVFLNDNSLGIQAFHEASESWEDDYCADKLLKVASKLNEKTKKYDQHYQWLRQLRKKGTLLLIYWKIFSENHQAPASFDKLVKQLGKFKDKANSGVVSDKDVKKIRKSLSKYEIDRDTHIFNVAAPASLKEAYLSHIIYIRNLLLQEKLSLREFHELRKTIRLLNKYFFAAEQYLDDEKSKNTYLFLHSISGTMGEIQDVIVELKLEGLVDRDTFTISLTPEHRSMIQSFVELN